MLRESATHELLILSCLNLNYTALRFSKKYERHFNEESTVKSKYCDTQYLVTDLPVWSLEMGWGGRRDKARGFGWREDFAAREVPVW